MFTISDIRLGIMTASVMLGEVCRYLWGEPGIFLEVLLVFMALDYASGLGAAYLRADIGLDSRRGLKGIVKKLMILVLISLAHSLDRVIGQGQDYIVTVMTLFFIGNEGLSIMENSAKAGLPVPLKLKNTLIQLKDMGGEQT